MILKPRLFRKPRWNHPLSRGLVGLWLFNEGSGNKVFDLSGNGNAGTISSGVVWEPGKFGPCLYNDASGNHVNCGDMSQIEGVGAFSVSFWAMHKTGSVPGTQFLLAKYGDVGDRVFTFYTTDSELVLFTVFNSEASSAYGYCLNVFKTAYKWRHIVGVYDGANIYVYVDSVVGSTVGNLTGVTDSSTSPLVLLAENTFGQNDFGGLIDNVKVYNRALSVSEIAQLYREPFCMFERDLIELWSAATLGAAPPAGMAGAMTTNTGYWGW